MLAAAGSSFAVLTVLISSEFVGPKERDPDLDVSDDAIFTNRLTIEEIKELPKFSNYERGKTSEVNAVYVIRQLVICLLGSSFR